MLIAEADAADSVAVVRANTIAIDFSDPAKPRNRVRAIATRFLTVLSGPHRTRQLIA